MKEYKIQPSEDQTHIVLKIVGEFEGKQMLKYIIEAHALGKELGIKNYLVDVTEARNVDSTINNYKFASSNIDNVDGIDKNANVIALINERDHSHDFVAAALKNTGHPIQVFTDPELVRSYFEKQKTA